MRAKRDRGQKLPTPLQCDLRHEHKVPKAKERLRRERLGPSLQGAVMGLSETIIAASIGAAATVSTALFQLVSALRSNNRVDVRPKKGSTVKSIAAVVALMVVAAVGGFLFSEFRNERNSVDMQSMRDDINSKLLVLAQTTERLAMRSDAQNSIPQPLANLQSTAQVTAPLAAQESMSAITGTTESVVYAAACESGASCTETNTQPVALCGAIPVLTQAREFSLYLKDANSSDVAKVEFDQEITGAKFAGPPQEFSQDEQRKAVCVKFFHWSERAHIATLVIRYGSVVDAESHNQSAVASTVVAAQPTLTNASAIGATVAR